MLSYFQAVKIISKNLELYDIDAFQASLVLASLFPITKEDALNAIAMERSSNARKV